MNRRRAARGVVPTLAVAAIIASCGGSDSGGENGAAPVITDFAFVDDPVGGSLSSSEVDMGNADAEPLHTPEDIEQLLRTFHDRVT